MKSDVMPYSLIDVHRIFLGAYCFHLQGRRISQASSQQGAAGKKMFEIYFPILMMAVIRSSENVGELLPDYTALHPRS
jgi:hypothetical protein